MENLPTDLRKIRQIKWSDLAAMFHRLLKGDEHEILSTVFFQKSVVPRPLKLALKYFRILRLREVIHENSSLFRVNNTRKIKK